eukprot:50994-Prorocentrum_minimum.AAC.1
MFSGLKPGFIQLAARGAKRGHADGSEHGLRTPVFHREALRSAEKLKTVGRWHACAALSHYAQLCPRALLLLPQYCHSIVTVLSQYCHSIATLLTRGSTLRCKQPMVEGEQSKRNRDDAADILQGERSAMKRPRPPSM